MSAHYRRALVTALLVLGAIVLTGAVAGFASTGNVQTVRIQSRSGKAAKLDFPPKGNSPGDIVVFQGQLLSSNGRTVVGSVHGTATDLNTANGMVTTQTMLTFKLGSGNELVVGGLGVSPLSRSGLIKNKVVVNAVLGGTGRYAGAHGTVTTKRLSNGRYDHVFKLTY